MNNRISLPEDDYTSCQPMPTPSKQEPPKPKRPKKSRGKRVGLLKSVRFAVFSRDNFTCRYCGRQPDDVELRCDHIVPVCQGGNSEPENLITSCFDCNAGKGGKTIGQCAPTEADRLRILQEHREQMSIQQAALSASKARHELRQTVCNHYCDLFGRQEMDKRALTTYVSFVEKYGPEMVFRWMECTQRVLGVNERDDRIGKYICGIRRRLISEGQLTEEGLCQ